VDHRASTPRQAIAGGQVNGRAAASIAKVARALADDRVSVERAASCPARIVTFETTSKATKKVGFSWIRVGAPHPPADRGSARGGDVRCEERR
jgi:hypothetical protein